MGTIDLNLSNTGVDLSVVSCSKVGHVIMVMCNGMYEGWLVFTTHFINIVVSVNSLGLLHFKSVVDGMQVDAAYEVLLWRSYDYHRAEVITATVSV